MKTYYTFFLIALIIQLGCNKEDVESQIPVWSKVTALKNLQNWETQTVALKDSIRTNSRISILANIHNEYGYLRESLGFEIINIKLGRQELFPFAYNTINDSIYSNYTTFSDDGDVVEDRFVILEDEDNFIDIQHLDMDKMEMDGIFQVTFIRDINDPIDNTSLPDTIRFTNGGFCLKMVDWH